MVGHGKVLWFDTTALQASCRVAPPRFPGAMRVPGGLALLAWQQRISKAWA